MRKILGALLGLALIAGALWAGKEIIGSKEKRGSKVNKVITSVLIDTVVNKDVPIVIKNNGQATAFKKIDLFSEVQGIFTYSSQPFKTGQKYKKGEILIKLNSDEFAASIVSQRSQIKNQIASMLPDLRFDYPNSFKKWEVYLNKIKLNRSLPPIPKFDSDQEYLFVTQKQVITTYYTIKNLEERLQKYTIYAPFDGVLTDALVNKGTLIRAGQQLGEFINPGEYEIEINLQIADVNYLKPGKEVEVTNINRDKFWNGEISRINEKINSASQTVKVYVKVEGDDIKEGMYLTVEIQGRDEPNALSIPRNVLIENEYVYVVRDTILQSRNVEVLHKDDKEVIVRGLKDGEVILIKPVPGAYDGMLVKPYNPVNP